MLLRFFEVISVIDTYAEDIMNAVLDRGKNQESLPLDRVCSASYSLFMDQVSRLVRITIYHTDKINQCSALQLRKKFIQIVKSVFLVIYTEMLFSLLISDSAIAHLLTSPGREILYYM